jgi:hypothetical protein
MYIKTFISQAAHKGRSNDAKTPAHHKTLTPRRVRISANRRSPFSVHIYIHAQFIISAGQAGNLAGVILSFKPRDKADEAQQRAQFIHARFI